MSKRSLIFAALAILFVIAAIFSVYLEKKQVINDYESVQEPEVEPEEQEPEEHEPIILIPDEKTETGTK
jgi:cbb3-type cytochrome oxidase subunit 3